MCDPKMFHSNLISILVTILLCILHLVTLSCCAVLETTPSENTISLDHHLPSTKANVSFACAKDEFTCLGTEECIPLVWQCDHKIDCSDGSDESIFEDTMSGEVEANFNSSSACIACEAHTFRCAQSEECIPRGWLCDGQPDCGSGDTSDETMSLCGEIAQTLLHQDDQTANITAGLLLDQPHVLLYNQSQLITLIRSFGNVSNAFYPLFGENQTLDIGPMLTTTRDSNLCWLDRSRATLRCISLLYLIVYPGNISTLEPEESQNQEYSIPSYIDAKGIARIALDWLTGNWYLLDARNELLYLCTHQLSQCRVILDHRVLRRPLALEVDAAEGLIFISRRGDRSRIGTGSLGPAILKADLDGTQVETVVEVRLIEPTHLAIDVTNRKVYWIDTKLDLLEYTDYNGTSRHTIRDQNPTREHQSWTQTLSLSANANRVYLVTRENQVQQSYNSIAMSVLYMSRNASTWQTFDNAKNLTFTNATIVYNVVQSSVAKMIARLCEPCEKKLCVPSFDHVARQIISGQCFESNESQSPLMIYSRGEPGLIWINSLNSTSSENSIQPITFAHFPTTFDLDPQTGWIYYFDDCDSSLGAHSLSFAAANLNQTQVIRKINLDTLGLKHIESIALDWIYLNLYLIEDSSIFVLGMRNQTLQPLKTLVTNLTRPKDLVLDLTESLLFYSQHGDGALINPSISVSWMDGSEVKVLVDSDVKFPTSLALDHSNMHLYWCDTFFRRIERINYDGSDRKVILQSLRVGIATSLYYFEQSLYWTELQHGTVQRYNLTSKLATILVQDTPPLYQVKILGSKVPNATLDTLQLSDRKCQHLTLSGRPNTSVSCVCDDHFRVDPETPTQCLPMTPEELTESFCGRTNQTYCMESRACAVVCRTKRENKSNQCTIDGYEPTPEPKVVSQCDGFKEFLCDNGQRCIPWNWLCDGHKDCHDQSDEVLEWCELGSICPPDHFRCFESQLCVPEVWRCDHDPDCETVDGNEPTDEANCTAEEGHLYNSTLIKTN